ncbi:hypothetical protein WICPIJ_009234 [Wickerhamomyces pijperi]|uniref:Uncharacterized protein n=1 Tax=Wickerhamomyces pijperi TaxID=599730 RepID=A0A9P8TED4_WICPI|nr:hypothetical protein WICPIJ_009234 [Wickerhamomyces pijperi]
MQNQLPNQPQSNELILIQKRLSLVLSVNSILITRAIQLQTMVTQAKSHTTQPPASVLQSITNLQTNIYKCLHGNLTFIAKVTEMFTQVQQQVQQIHAQQQQRQPQNANQIAMAVAAHVRNQVSFLETLKPTVLECPDPSVHDLKQMYMALNILFSDQAVHAAHRGNSAGSATTGNPNPGMTPGLNNNNNNGPQFATRNM